MIVEYEDESIVQDDWYKWKDKDATYDSNFYMSESLKEGYAIDDHDGL